MPYEAPWAEGDRVQDQNDPARRLNTLLTVLHYEATRMEASHRQARLSFQTPITDARYDTDQTICLHALGVLVQGKLARVYEQWDINTGRELATLTLALRRGGYSTNADPLTAPAPPTFDLGAAPPSHTQLASQFGGRNNSPPFDDELDSVSGNYSWTAPGAESYPRRLQFNTPDIDALHRDQAEAETSASYQLNLPSDLLLVEVP